VLGSLTSLQIRAEYRSGADTDSLDNVVLNGISAVPEPSTFLLLGVGSALLLASRRLIARRASL
jgi:hypothetical protein